MRTIHNAFLICILIFIMISPAAAQDKTATTGEKDKPAAVDKTIPKLKRADILKALTTRGYQVPSKWPLQRRWSPRRHFGPLYGNSPDVHLNGGAATFVYNRFFDGNPDANVFQKYYGSPLPSNQPTQPEIVPGTLPASGFRDVRMSFDRLTYSSRYGGSFKLLFRTLEDFQVEYKKADAAWDISSLEMAVYVRPVPSYFNPNSPLYFIPDGSIHVEFRAQGVIGYAVSSNGNLTLQDGDPLPALITALAESSQSMVGSSAQTFRSDAARFSHGLVHSAFWEEIGQTRNVTGIELSDNLFLPHTSQSLPVAVVAVQVSDIRLDTEPGSEEIYITLDAAHMFSNVSIYPSFSWEFPQIDDRGSTAWKTVGVFPLDWDCGQLETVMLTIKVQEEDGWAFDDEFDTSPDAFQTGPLPCSGMQTAFENGQFGLYKTLPEQQLLLVNDDGDVAGAMTVRMRISVIKQ
jgi:hypothetical protein